MQGPSSRNSKDLRCHLCPVYIATGITDQKFKNAWMLWGIPKNCFSSSWLCNIRSLGYSLKALLTFEAGSSHYMLGS